VDETGDLEKGTCSAGFGRQYTRPAGRIENAQVAVYLTYAAPAGHALTDRELYLPRAWADDRARCLAAGIPGATRFATKPALARKMIAGPWTPEPRPRRTTSTPQSPPRSRRQAGRQAGAGARVSCEDPGSGKEAG
jgi:hypothetical protein